jgi:hypothetical protein
MTENASLSSTPGDGAPNGDPYKILVRLIAGAIGEGLDRLMEANERLEHSELAATPEVAGPFVTNRIAMAIVGFTYELPEQIAAASTSVSRTIAPFTAVASATFNAGSGVAEATGIAPYIAERTQPTRTALVKEFDRLISVGSGEYARGRVLAVGAFTESMDGIVSYLGDSEEVKELVREQTLGMTGAAVQEIRETGATADGLTEAIFRKIFRRDFEPLPPKPSFDTE